MKTTLPAFALFLLAFLLRVSYSLSLPNALIHPDAPSFDGIAWNLVSLGHYAATNPDRGGAIEPTARRPPSYPLFLAAVYRVAGHSIPATRITQSLLGSLLVWMIFHFAHRLSPDQRVPIIAAGLAAFYPFFIYYDGCLIAESFLAFSLFTTLFFFARWTESPANFSRAAAWGLSSAILSLAKTTFIPLTALCLATEACFALRSQDFRRRMAAVLLAAGVFTTPVLAWGFRNQKVLGRFLLDSHGGISFIHCTVFYDSYKQGTFGEVFKNHPIREMAKTLDEAQCDDFYYRVTRSYIRTHPADFGRQVVNKIVDFWRFYPRQDIHFPEGTRKITIISLLTEPFLLSLGAFGLWKTRHLWRQLYPLYAAILLLTMVHAISCSQMRYRLPLMPFMIVFATYAAVTWKDSLSMMLKRFRPAHANRHY